MLVPKLLEICQISVRNLSENSQLQNSVRYLSELCQMTVRNQSVANICQNSIRKDLEIRQKCVRFYKCVRKLSVIYLENCLKSVRNITSDTFLTHLSSFVGYVNDNLAPSCSDKIRAKILDLGYGGARRALHNLSAKSARILSAAITRTILPPAGARCPVTTLNWLG